MTSELSGNQLDSSLANLLAEQFQVAHGFDPRDDLASLAALRRGAERLKVRLCSRATDVASLTMVVADRVLETAPTRRQLERETATRLDQAAPCAHRCCRRRGSIGDN